MKYNSILESIGNTPHIRLNKLFPEHEVWLKLERQNPGGSIKDRIALAMIEDAEANGILKPGGTIIEPTSGNTGIGLSMVGAIKGYKVIITMPESMSIERRKSMSAFGAEFVLTPREQGMKGAIEKAKELAATIEGAWIPEQFENPSNPAIHRTATAQEIIKDFPDGFDYFVSGVGTGGHISGIGETLKQCFPNIKIIAVEPEQSPVLSGGAPAPHPLQGIGAGFIPKNMNTKILDGIQTISKDDAYEYARKLAKKEGIFAGISTGASLAAIARILNKSNIGTKIISINYDTGERYLSVDGLY
ncbi:cysteine synthase A [Dysgonomonas sp. 216]|uniref:cysteine synthase A n=1 Tax=Dysgonomonas sp. 216 TaxID=2302934 RepID=UPI0013D49A0B|nr:cysteine synthase A [Dysgonomonas sp. 216]NDW19578.1 cysteine synthase A [Dysgonomonas sp. 216]